MSEVTSAKVPALDAAIELLGTEGLRALTHARVDSRAGLPKGSTSNYFRTRAALLTGVADRILEREVPQVEPATFSPATADDLVDALCRLFEYLTGTNRIVTTARLVLFLEGSPRCWPPGGADSRPSGNCSHADSRYSRTRCL